MKQFKQLSLLKPDNSLSMSYSGVSFFKDIKMSKSQKLNFSRLNEKEKLKYLMSFFSKQKVSIKNRSGSASQKDILSYNSNKYYNMFLRSCDSTSEKRPLVSSKEFHFGIEIECIIPITSKIESMLDMNTTRYETCYSCEGSGKLEYYNSVVDDYIERDCITCEGSGEIESEDYDSIDSLYESNEDDFFEECHNVLKKIISQAGIKGARVQSDGSIREQKNSGNYGLYFPVEISILTTDFKNLKKLTDLLKDLEAEVNSTCGLHVHLDMRYTDFSVSHYAKIFEEALPFLSLLIPKSRRENDYCVPRVSKEKYSAFNINTDFETIECRMHTSTTDFQKIKNWCLLLKKIMASENLEPIKEISYMDDFFKAINLDQDIKDFYMQRYIKFNSIVENSQDIENDEAV